MPTRTDYLAAIGLLVLAMPARADVSLPRLLGDGVILQRDAPVFIWGRADEGERVQVFVDGVRAGLDRASEGRFRVDIGSHAAGGPHRVVVAGNNQVVIEDVWFGDVWVAGGQSNMELSMERVATRFPDAGDDADFPLIREFKVPRKYAFDAPAEDFDDGEWKRTTPESVLGSSAVAYYFARELHERYDVPIGIINDNYGGSAAESWMSEEALADYPHYLDIATAYRDPAYLEGLIDADQQRVDAWHADVNARDEGLSADPPWSAADVRDADWETMPVPGFFEQGGAGEVDGAAWYRRSLELSASAAGQPARLYLGRIDDADTAWVNGVEVGSTGYMWPPRIYDVPAGVLRAGSNSIAVRVIDGGGSGGFIADKEYRLVVGDESHELNGDWRFRLGASAAPQPAPEFVSYRQPLGFYNAMLAPLANFRIKGVIWYQGETNVGRDAEYQELFPDMIRDWRRLFRQGDFPFLFVQLANYLETQPEPVDSAWAALREAQRQSLRVPNTAMAVTIDVGEWNDIHPLDKETVGERLALAAMAIAYGEQNVVYSGPVLREIERKGKRLVLGFDHAGGGLVADGDELRGFAVAGATGDFAWASARIDDDKVIVESAGVDEPVRVRYAWADNPESANLYNAEGLPASPFEARVASPAD